MLPVIRYDPGTGVSLAHFGGYQVSVQIFVGCSREVAMRHSGDSKAQIKTVKQNL
jgi:hypothetical protein